MGDTRRDIQMLRGIAVLAVMLNHFGGLLPGGFLGVDLFFAVSGYVIFQSLAKQIEDGRGLGQVLAEFWKRRFWRLVPALSVVLLFTALASFAFLTPRDFRDQLEMIGWSTIFAGNIGVELVSRVDYFDPAADQNWLLHLWSLGVEEQFYLLFPLVVVGVYVLSRKTFSSRGMFLMLVAITLASLGLAWVNELLFARTAGDGGDLGSGVAAALGYYSPLTRAWEFGFGALAALLRPRLSTFSTPLTLGALAVLALSLGFFPESNLHPGPLALVPLASVFAILLFSPDNLRGSNPVARAMQWVGDRSYSLYLWHWTIWSLLNQFSTIPPLVQIVLAGALTVGLADRTFIHVEQRFRRRNPKGQLSGVERAGQKASAIAFFIGPLAAVLGLQMIFTSVAQAGRLPVATPISQVEPKIDCLQTPCSSEEFEVLLVGDSHSGAIANALDAKLDEANISMRAAVLNRKFGCLHLPSTSVVSIHEECQELSAQVRATIDEVRPEVLVIYGYTAGRFTEINSGKKKEIEIRYQASSDVIEPNEAAEAYAIALGEVIDFAAARNVAVVIVSGTPDFDSRPEEVDSQGQKASIGQLIASSFGTTLLGMTVSVSEQIERHGSFREIENRLAQSAESVSLVDSWSVLCSDESCSQADNNGVFLYSDHDHLSPEGAALLVPLISDAVQRVLVD